MRLFFFFLIRGSVVFSLTFIIFALIRKYFFRDLKRKSTPKKEIFLCLFAAYIATMALFLFLPNFYIASKGINLTSNNFNFLGDFKDRINSGSWGVNLIPFRTIKSYIKYSSISSAFSNIVGNILIFIPFGFLVPIIFENKRRFYKILFLSILISFIFESIQFFTGRSVDIDDLILNALGGVIGYFIFYIRSKNSVFDL